MIKFEQICNVFERQQQDESNIGSNEASGQQPSNQQAAIVGREIDETGASLVLVARNDIVNGKTCIEAVNLQSMQRRTLYMHSGIMNCVSASLNQHKNILAFTAASKVAQRARTTTAASPSGTAKCQGTAYEVFMTEVIPSQQPANNQEKAKSSCKRFKMESFSANYQHIHFINSVNHGKSSTHYFMFVKEHETIEIYSIMTSAPKLPSKFTFLRGSEKPAESSFIVESQPRFHLSLVPSKSALVWYQWNQEERVLHYIHVAKDKLKAEEPKQASQISSSWLLKRLSEYRKKNNIEPQQQPKPESKTLDAQFKSVRFSMMQNQRLRACLIVDYSLPLANDYNTLSTKQVEPAANIQQPFGFHKIIINETNSVLCQYSIRPRPVQQSLGALQTVDINLYVFHRKKRISFTMQCEDKSNVLFCMIPQSSILMVYTNQALEMVYIGDEEDSRLLNIQSFSKVLIRVAGLQSTGNYVEWNAVAHRHNKLAERNYMDLSSGNFFKFSMMDQVTLLKALQHNFLQVHNSMLDASTDMIRNQKDIGATLDSLGDLNLIAKHCNLSSITKYTYCFVVQEFVNLVSMLKQEEEQVAQVQALMLDKLKILLLDIILAQSFTEMKEFLQQSDKNSQFNLSCFLNLIPSSFGELAGAQMNQILSQPQKFFEDPQVFNKFKAAVGVKQRVAPLKGKFSKIRNWFHAAPSEQEQTTKRSILLRNGFIHSSIPIKNLTRGTGIESTFSDSRVISFSDVFPYTNIEIENEVLFSCLISSIKTNFLERLNRDNFSPALLGQLINQVEEYARHYLCVICKAIFQVQTHISSYFRNYAQKLELENTEALEQQIEGHIKSVLSNIGFVAALEFTD